MDINEVLQYQLPVFKEEALKDELITSAQLMTVDEGTQLMKEGSYVKVVPILLSGLVKVTRQEMGKEMLLYYIYPLESCIVSIHCGMNDVKSRIKAIAEEESSVILIPSTKISDWQQKYPSFNQFILNLYQKRFDDVLDAYNALAFQSLDDRLINYLELKSKAFKNVRIQTTHQELGDELGTARETISRMLKKLELEGKVVLGRGVIELVH